MADLPRSLEAVAPTTTSPTFDDLYRRDYRSVVALAYGLCGSRSAAEELAQDAFLATFRRWGAVSDYERPGAFVRRLVMNRAVSRGRTRAAERKALARVAQTRVPFGELAPGDEEFWSSVRALPRRQAQVVTLRYLEDRSIDEIADVLGCTAGTVKTHLFRARQGLAAALGCSDDERRTDD